MLKFINVQVCVSLNLNAACYDKYSVPHLTAVMLPAKNLNEIMSKAHQYSFWSFLIPCSFTWDFYRVWFSSFINKIFMFAREQQKLIGWLFIFTE